MASREKGVHEENDSDCEIILPPRHDGGREGGVDVREEKNSAPAWYRFALKPGGRENRRARAWLGTLFRYDDEMVASMQRRFESLEHEGVLGCCCWQEEKCSRTGRNHIQFYLQYTRPLYRSVLRRLFDELYRGSRGALAQESESAAGNSGVHLEVCGPDSLGAYRYCQKDDTFTGRHRFSIGRVHAQGARTDIETIKEMIEDGKSLMEVADKFPKQFIRYHTGIGKMMALSVEDRDYAPEVTVCWGPTGTGKTTYVRSLFDKDAIYFVHKGTYGNVWFTGYDPHKHSVLLFDDFYGWFPLYSLLCLLDSTPYSLPIHGGIVPMRAREVIFTSNVAPEDWYHVENDEVKRALWRRMGKLIEFVIHVCSDESEEVRMFDRTASWKVARGLNRVVRRFSNVVQTL